MKNAGMFFAGLAACAALVAGGCRRTDVRDFAIRVPGLTPAAEAKVRDALKPYGGVELKSIRFDQAAKTVFLRYDSMQIAKKNIEMALAAKGLEANGVTPASVGK